MAAPVKISANPPDCYQGVYSSDQGAAGKSHGPFVVGSAQYLVLSNDQGGGDFQLEVHKSTDGGATWALQDGANGPHVLGWYSAVLVGSIIELVYCNLPPDLLRRTTYQEFSTAPDDTWGAKSQAANTTDTNGDIHAVRLSNGDYLAMYVGSSDVYSIRRTSGVWGVATIQFAHGTSPQGLGLAADSSDTGYFVWSEVAASVRRLKMRSLTLGGTLSAEFIVSIGTAGASFITSPIAVWQDRLEIPQTYDEVGFPDAPAGSPGLWEGTPLSAPVWTFKAAGPITPSPHVVSFVPLSANSAFVFWTTTTDGAIRIYRAAYDGSTFGTPTIFYNWDTNPPAGGGVVPSADQLLKQPTYGADGLDMALLMAYNFPDEDYSTFYFGGPECVSIPVELLGSEIAENLWTTQVTIPAGESESDGCVTQGRALVGITVPCFWTPAEIGYKGSFNGSLFYDAIKDRTGTLVQTTLEAGSDIAFPQPTTPFRPFLKLLSVDGAGVPVAQARTTPIILTFRRLEGGS